MLKNFTSGTEHIFLACGATDFRKQINGLTALVSMQLKMDPYENGYVFIFCNRKRDSIKVLRYNRNGFVLASKKMIFIAWGLCFQEPICRTGLSVAVKNGFFQFMNEFI